MAMQQLGRELVQQAPETVLVLSPHATVSRHSLPLHVCKRYQGSFRRFGVAQPTWSFNAAAELLTLLQAVPGVMTVPQSSLDHGALVPLAFMAEAGFKGSLALLGLPYMPAQTVFQYGQAVSRVLSAYPGRVAAVISGDLSHALTPDAPSGYSPYGKQFDETFVDAMQRWDVPALLQFDSELSERGAQDALGSAQFLAGLLADQPAVKAQMLSYEGPFGVGYLVESFYF